MARQWSTGFELQTVGSSGVGVEWDITSSAQPPTISTTIKRSGAASLRCHPSSGVCFIGHQILSSSTVTHVFLRVYLYIASMPTADTPIISWNNGVSATTVSGPYWSLRLRTDGTLQYIRSDGTTFGSSSAALSTGQWYRVEMDLQDSATTTGSAAFYLDGTQFTSVSGLGMNGANWIALGPHVSTSCDLYFDDFAINDTSGTAQTGLPGAGSIVHMVPDSAGDNAGWSAGAGGTANWNRVNETTPDDATTYNQMTATGSATDDFNMVSSSSVGIGSSDTITLVAVGGRIGSTSTSTANLVYRLKSQASGTVLSSSAVSVAVNGWRPHGSAAPRLYKVMSYVDTQAGGAWTPALLDTSQIGYTTSTSNTNSRRVSTLWALVEYVPSSGTAYTASPADSEGLTDATALTRGTTGADSEGLTDAASRTMAVARAPADTTGLSDAAALTRGTTGTDSQGLADAAALTRGTTGADSEGLTDAATTAVAAARAPADTAGLTDAAATAVAAARTAGDTAGLTDAAGTALSVARTAGDLAGLTDTAAVARGSGQADQVGLTDTASTVATTARTAGDTAGLTDGAALTRGMTRADSQGLSDAAATVVTAARTTADTVGAVDAASAVVTVARAAGDGLGLVDVAGVGRGTGQADQLALADTAATALAAARAPADTAGLTDDVTVTLSGSGAQTVADGISLTDAASAVVTVARAAGDGLGLVDVAGVGRGTGQTDQLGLADTAATALAAARAPADTVGLVDVAGTVVAAARAGADLVGLIDAAAATRVSSRAAGDVVGLTDAVSKTLTRAAGPADHIGLTDMAIAVRTLLPAVAEAIGLTDTVDAVLTRNAGGGTSPHSITVTSMSGSVEQTSRNGAITITWPDGGITASS